MTPSTAMANSGKAEPAWDIVKIFPRQGDWHESDYLSVTNSTNQLVELVDGHIRVLPMPKTSHQRIVQFLHELLKAFVSTNQLGETLFAPLRLRLREGLFREPDIIFASREHARYMGEDYWTGADLLMEVVSPDQQSHHRDWVEKRREYAEAGIPEYWIIDPQQRRIVVFRLEAGAYVTHADVGESGLASSALLPGFTVEAADVWTAAAEQ